MPHSNQIQFRNPSFPIPIIFISFLTCKTIIEKRLEINFEKFI